ncbi:MAG: DUF6273 domain-containing protein [Defluviitaleaceae bacterium]|nr:DUF6273 domain-containing protein [Defluviitaleaceae bacterium]
MRIFSKMQKLLGYNSLQIGQITPFGGYDWQVLDIQNNQALLLSELVLEKRPYNTTQTPITWEQCTLRRYLNNDFYNKLPQNGKIAQRTIPNNNNQWFGTDGGNDTTDHIFLLSLDEVVQYFGDSGQLKVKNKSPISWGIEDQFNDKRIARDTSGAAAWWWLRSPGKPTYIAASIHRKGYVNVCGYDYDVVGEGGVRPALWLNL